MTELEQRMARLIGKRALVGITYVKPDGERRIQMHGVISRGVENMAIYLRSGGEEFSLPPDPDAFHPAEPGRYTLKTTGEVVDNPDFTASWTVHPPG